MIGKLVRNIFNTIQLQSTLERTGEYIIYSINESYTIIQIFYHLLLLLSFIQNHFDRNNN